MSSTKKIIFIILSIFFVSSLMKSIVDYKKKYQFYLEFRRKYQKEKKENIILKTELLKKTDSQWLEKIIRNKLNLSKSGEEVLIIPKQKQVLIQPTPMEIPNWQKWKKLYLR